MWPNLESESAYFQGPFEMIIRTDIERKLFFTSKFSPDKGILVIRHKIKIIEIIANNTKVRTLLLKEASNSLNISC